MRRTRVGCTTPIRPRFPFSRLIIVDMQLTRAVVLVTGASAGIGQVAAAEFAAKGARVLVHGRDPQRTQEVADEIGGRALIADLASPAERERLATDALNAFGHV